jgi:hypothetical protein
VFPGWEDAFQGYGQFRRAITGGVCVAWRESCQQAYMYVCMYICRSAADALAVCRSVAALPVCVDVFMHYCLGLPWPGGVGVLR